MPSSACVQVKFRRASRADIDAVVSLVELAYRGTEGWTEAAEVVGGQRIDAQMVEEALENADKSAFLLAFAIVTDENNNNLNEESNGGQLVACCHVERHGIDVAHFGTFAVDPNIQRCGIGARVLAEAERIALKELGCERMEMEVIELQDKLITWYQRRGYQRSGIYIPFPYDNPRMGIPRRADIRFELLTKELSKQHDDDDQRRRE